MHYVLEAWKITRELPRWENQDCNITHKCFQSLSQFCAETIRRGNFDISTLEIYIERYVKQNKFPLFLSIMRLYNWRS